jgi:hypothetical protein
LITTSHLTYPDKSFLSLTPTRPEKRFVIDWPPHGFGLNEPHELFVCNTISIHAPQKSLIQCEACNPLSYCNSPYVSRRTDPSPVGRNN